MIYDAIMTTSLYNRMMWGNSPQTYAAFAEKGLNAKKEISNGL